MTEQAKTTQGRMEQAVLEIVCRGCGGFRKHKRRGPACQSTCGVQVTEIMGLHREELAAAEVAIHNEAPLPLTSEQIKANDPEMNSYFHEEYLKWFVNVKMDALARHDQELTERVLEPVKALVEHWKSEGKRCYDLAYERTKADESVMAQSVRFWECARDLEALLKAGPRG